MFLSNKRGEVKARSSKRRIGGLGGLETIRRPASSLFHVSSSLCFVEALSFCSEKLTMLNLLGTTWHFEVCESASHACTSQEYACEFSIRMSALTYVLLLTLGDHPDTSGESACVKSVSLRSISWGASLCIFMLRHRQYISTEHDCAESDASRSTPQRVDSFSWPAKKIAPKLSREDKHRDVPQPLALAHNTVLRSLSQLITAAKARYKQFVQDSLLGNLYARCWDRSIARSIFLLP